MHQEPEILQGREGKSPNIRDTPFGYFN